MDKEKVKLILSSIQEVKDLILPIIDRCYEKEENESLRVSINLLIYHGRKPNTQDDSVKSDLWQTDDMIFQNE